MLHNSQLNQKMVFSKHFLILTPLCFGQGQTGFWDNYELGLKPWEVAPTQADGTIKTTVYWKPSQTDQYLFNSNHHLQHKKICYEAHSAQHLVSEEEDRGREVWQIQGALQAIWYTDCSQRSRVNFKFQTLWFPFPSTCCPPCVPPLPVIRSFHLPLVTPSVSQYIQYTCWPALLPWQIGYCFLPAVVQ